MATHSSVLAWGISGMGEPGRLPSMGSHRVGQDWNDLAAAAAVNKLCLLCDPMAWSLPVISVHGNFQARLLEWVAISFSVGSSWRKNGTLVSCIARQILYHWDTWEAWALRYQTVINMVETCVEKADENNSDVPSLWLPLVHTVEGACEKFPASDLDVQLFCEISLFHKVIFSLTFFHTMYLVHQNTCLILVTYMLSWRNMLGTLFLALFLILYCLEKFKFHNKIEGKVQRFLISLLLPHLHNLTQYQHHSPLWYLFYWGAHFDTSESFKVYSLS